MQQKDFDRAQEWFKKHESHVCKLITGKHDIPEIEPSGSDAARPELWKDIHWAWFFANRQN